MADLLKTGAEWLAGQLKAHAGHAIEYRRGGSSVALTAIHGRTLLKLSDDYGGVKMEHTDRDYLIASADLVLSGNPVLPQKGDVIAEEEDGTTYVYEVLAPPGEPPWRWSGADRVLMRVHVKLVGTE